MVEADEDPVEKKDATERRVYNLPAALLARLRAYQVNQHIPSEAEAARRLIDTALQLRDTFAEILDALEKRFREERDLRVLASEVVKHILVQEVTFQDGALVFRMSSGDRGRLSFKGDLHFSTADLPGDAWTDYRAWRRKQRAVNALQASATNKWDQPGTDLEDEIPF